MVKVLDTSHTKINGRRMAGKYIRQAYKQMLNIISQQGNENSNHSERAFHTTAMAKIKKTDNTKC